MNNDSPSPFPLINEVSRCKLISILSILFSLGAFIIGPSIVLGLILAVVSWKISKDNKSTFLPRLALAISGSVTFFIIVVSIFYCLLTKKPA